jgi:hypothetical protein
MSGVVALVRRDLPGGAMMVSRLAKEPRLRVRLPLCGQKKIHFGAWLDQNAFEAAINARERAIDQTRCLS